VRGKRTTSGVGCGSAAAARRPRLASRRTGHEVVAAVLAALVLGAHRLLARERRVAVRGCGGLVAITRAIGKAEQRRQRGARRARQAQAHGGGGGRGEQQQRKQRGGGGESEGARHRGGGCGARSAAQ
jgi:hypothetical protein